MEITIDKTELDKLIKEIDNSLENKPILNKIKITDRNELKKIIFERKIPLETLDVSAVTDMSDLFRDIRRINGSIADWDVSNVTNMEKMFHFSKIQPDISKWDVSKVTNMSLMFYDSIFRGDISSWNVSYVTTMKKMFEYSDFNGDISIQANEPWRVRKWNANERIINNSLLIVNEDKR